MSRENKYEGCLTASVRDASGAIVYAGERAYVAERGTDGTGDTRVYVKEGGARRPLPHVKWHSPAGYEWNCGGSGPADLALSILADYFGERPGHDQLYHGEPRCWKLHQAFKWAHIATQPYEGFRLPARTVAAWVSAHDEDDEGGEGDAMG